MALPKFQDFLYPFLKKLEDGKDVTSKEMKTFLIEHFHLTPEDCALKTKSGKTIQFEDRYSWTRQWLRRALLIMLPKRGLYRITDRGKDYLKNHTSLKESDLLEYPEYAEYVGKSPKNGNSVSTRATNLDAANSTPTPTEQLESAYQIIVKDLAADLLQKILEQSPKRFEQIVVDLMLAMGYGGSLNDAGMVTKYSHDDGIDGVIKEDKLGLDKIYIQAKRYSIGNTIGKPDLHAFAGALDEKKANKGVFITTSKFTSEARKFAEEKASKKIVLIDGEELARYMIEYNIGVSTRRTYTVKRIDTDYFEEDDNDI